MPAKPITDPLFQSTDEAIQFHLHLARRFRDYAFGLGEPAGSDNWCVARDELATAHRLIRRKRKIEAKRQEAA